MTEDKMAGDAVAEGKVSAGTKEGLFWTGLVQVGKYLVLLAIVAYILFLMIHTSGSTRPFEEVAGAVEASLDTKALVRQDGRGLKRYFGLNSADYEGVLYYSAESNMSAEEVVLICTESEEQTQVVRAAFEERIESRKADFEGYAPEQAALLEQARLSVRGNYVFLAVSENAETYESVFNGSL